MRRIILASATAAIVAHVVSAQQPGPQPAGANVSWSFEAASVKPNTSGDPGGNLRRQPGGRVNAVNMPLRTLVTFAYQVQPFMLVGGPGWMATDRFDIVAKLEGDPPPTLPGSGPDALSLAMRALLADRFRLRVHRETRDVDIYALVMARPGGNPGLALKPSTQDCSPQGLQARRGGPPPPAVNGAPPVFCGMQIGPGRIQFGGFPLSQFASGIAGLVGRVVVDRTGLTGNWDFELMFAAAPPRGPLAPGADVPAPDPDAPSIFTAVQEQLGLKLEATKGPVELLIIDSVERPIAD